VDNLINKPVEHDPSKDMSTVFVSNLSFDATEEDIKEVLGPSVKDVRLAKDFKVNLSLLFHIA